MRCWYATASAETLPIVFEAVAVVDKTVATLHRAMELNVDFPFELGSRGFCWCVAVNDGGGFESVRRHFAASVHVRLQNFVALSADKHAQFLPMKTLILGVQCVIHDIQTAFRWGLESMQLLEKPITTSCFAILASLRDSHCI